MWLEAFPSNFHCVEHWFHHRYQKQYLFFLFHDLWSLFELSVERSHLPAFSRPVAHAPVVPVVFCRQQPLVQCHCSHCLLVACPPCRRMFGGYGSHTDSSKMWLKIKWIYKLSTSQRLPAGTVRRRNRDFYRVDHELTCEAPSELTMPTESRVQFSKTLTISFPLQISVFLVFLVLKAFIAEKSNFVFHALSICRELTETASASVNQNAVFALEC